MTGKNLFDQSLITALDQTDYLSSPDQADTHHTLNLKQMTGKDIFDLSGHCALDQADYLSSPYQADSQPYSQPEIDDK